MTEENERPEPTANGRNVVSAWIIFATMLFGLVVFSAIDVNRSEHADAIAGKGEQRGTGEVQPGQPDMSGQFAEKKFREGLSLWEPRYSD